MSRPEFPRGYGMFYEGWYFGDDLRFTIWKVAKKEGESLIVQSNLTLPVRFSGDRGQGGQPTSSR